MLIIKGPHVKNVFACLGWVEKNVRRMGEGESNLARSGMRSMTFVPGNVCQRRTFLNLFFRPLEKLHPKTF